MKCFFTYLIMLCLMVTSLRTQAEDLNPNHTDEQQARQFFNRAEESFRSGLFAEALAAYRRGYALHPLPGFLINIAQCHRRMGDLQLARDAYLTFIQVAPDSRFVPEVNAVIGELDELLKDVAPRASAEKKLPEVEKPLSVEPKSLNTEAMQTSTPKSHHEQNVHITTPIAPQPIASAGTRWWLWGTVAGVAIVGVVTALVLRSPEATIVHDGSVGTLRR